jgi:hypothetical protein
MQEISRVRVRSGLSFYGTLGFVAGFFGARLFATLNPTAVVVDTHSGIHFHHFWYGLAMVTVAGWMGIALRNERLDRNLALIFGLGIGFIGDEVGLLLTFGDYSFKLASWFFAGAVAIIILVTLFWRFRKSIEEDVLKVSNYERLTQIGILLALFSTIFFAFKSFELGLVCIGLGVLIFLFAYTRERRDRELGRLGSLER